MELDLFGKKINKHNRSVGWWEDSCIFTKLQLVSTEIAEATEGERSDLMDTHLPNKKAGEVELADVLIRVLDIGNHLGILIYDEDLLPKTKIENSDSIGKQHYRLTEALIDFGIYYEAHLSKKDPLLLNKNKMIIRYRALVASILQVAAINRYDIKAAMIEKFKYNKHRADHKKSTRVKKF